MIVTNVQTHHVALIVTSLGYSIVQGELCQSGAAYIHVLTRVFACHNGHAHLIRMSAHKKIIKISPDNPVKSVVNYNMTITDTGCDDNWTCQ